MGRHLDIEAWFHKTSTGTLRRKRVSAVKEAQFPLRYRMIYQSKGLSSLVKAIMEEDDSTLSAAWDRIQQMIGKPKGRL